MPKFRRSLRHCEKLRQWKKLKNGNAPASTPVKTLKATMKSTTISVKVADIPPYLQRGQFYLSLQKDGENDCIPVPNECMKINDSVNSRHDLRSLLLTHRFWVTDGISDSVLDFAMSQPFGSYEDILSEFNEDLSAVKHIKPSRCLQHRCFRQ